MALEVHTRPGRSDLDILVKRRRTHRFRHGQPLPSPAWSSLTSRRRRTSACARSSRSARPRAGARSRTGSKQAREHGDIKENADYDAAKNEQGHNEARIRQIEAMLKNAVVVEQRRSGEVVEPGVLVELRYDGDDDDRHLPRRLDRGAPRHLRRALDRAHRSGRRSSAPAPGARRSATRAPQRASSASTRRSAGRAPLTLTPAPGAGSPRERTVRISRPSGASRRRSRSMCTSSALRVGSAAGPGPARERVARRRPRRSGRAAPGRATARPATARPSVAETQDAVAVEVGRAPCARRPRLQRRGARASMSVSDAPAGPSPRGSRSATGGSASPSRAAAGARPGPRSPRDVGDRSGQRTSSTFMRHTLRTECFSGGYDVVTGYAASPCELGRGRERPAPANRDPGSGPAARPARSRRSRRRPARRRAPGRSRSRRPAPARPRSRPSPARAPRPSASGSHVEAVAVGGPREQHPPARSLASAASSRRGARCRAARSAARAVATHTRRSPSRT